MKECYLGYCQGCGNTTKFQNVSSIPLSKREMTCPYCCDDDDKITSYLITAVEQSVTKTAATHNDSCETATESVCVCGCGGLYHGDVHIFSDGISKLDS
jgi:hypothetical protein